MFNFRKQKRQTNSTSNDTWRQVLADIRDALGIPGRGHDQDARESDNDPISHATEATSVEVPSQKEPPLPQPDNQEQQKNQELTLENTLPTVPAHTAGDEFPVAEQPVSGWRRIRHLSLRVKLSLGIGAIVVIVALVFREEIFAPWPPAPNVVAAFSGGQVTIEDVEKHLTSLVDDAETQQELKTPGGYALIVEEMLTDEIVRRWQTNRKPDQDKEFSHVMKHIAEEINLDELHTQMHRGQLGVTEGDIGAYYEANRKDFGEQTLTDAREEIKTKLESENEDQFVQNYITGLKNKASITKDLATLAVPPPADWDLKNYYDANKSQYVVKAQAAVHEIRIPKGGDEKKAKEKADQTLVKIRSGADFAEVYQEVAGMPLPQSGEIKVKDEQSSAYDEAVFRLDPGQISDVIADTEAFAIIRLVSKESERERSFEEVRSQVERAVLAETEKKYYADNADRTLFTVNGKRFTLGEFWEEYQELPFSFLASYAGTEGKQALVEKTIERLLLYEDSLSQVSQTETKERQDEMRLKVLARMMEQEEIDDKINIEDTELRDYYEENKERLVMPPKSKIRQIAIKAGETKDEHKRATDKVTEAYKKLVPELLGTSEDFASVAKQYSEDEETRDKGGEVTNWIKEEMDSFGEIVTHPYHEYILAIPKGEIGEPFEANGYMYIVQVVDRTEPERISFEDVKEYIRKRLQEEKHAKLSAELSSKLMKEYDVTIYMRTLKKIAKQAGDSSSESNELQ